MLPVQGIEASNFGGLVRPGVLIQSMDPLILSMEGFYGAVIVSSSLKAWNRWTQAWISRFWSKSPLRVSG